MRWRSAMGGSSSSRAAEPVGEYLSKKLASRIQADLDEYMVNNPEFPVSRQAASSFVADIWIRLQRLVLERSSL